MGFWEIMNLRAFCTCKEVPFLISGSGFTTFVPSAALTVADARTCGRWVTCLATNLGFMEVNFWPSFRQAFSVSVPKILEGNPDFQSFELYAEQWLHRVCVVPGSFPYKVKSESCSQTPYKEESKVSRI